MISKVNRLKSKEIPILAKRGKRFTFDFFDLKVWYTNTTPKFSIAVSKTIDKRAVVRNKIKRRFKVVIFNLIKENSIKPGNYLIVIKKREAIGLPLEEIYKQIKSIN